MKLPKSQNPIINTKLIIICSITIFLIILLLKSTYPSKKKPQEEEEAISTFQTPNIPNNNNNIDSSSVVITECNKIPPSLSQALVYYATTNITPQQTIDEISVTLRVLQKKSPCNFLVFGLGRDSLMWASLNHGGRTVFLEEDESWINQIKTKNPTLESYHVQYDTVRTQADELFAAAMADEECLAVERDLRESRCRLAMKGMPEEVYGVEWDLIMVDAPTGYHDGAPGRMSAVYTAGMMGRRREEGETEVFVHDVDRAVEDKFSRGFLCEGYLREQQGRLRHFTIPSHRTRRGRPFCP